jgi:hypothetical protein
MLPQNSSLVLLALECGIQSVLHTCTNQSCVTGEFSDLYDSIDDRLNSLIFYCLCICPQIERGWILKKHWFNTVSDFQLSLSGVSMYQHAMSVWFYIKSISRFPSQLVLNQLSVYWGQWCGVSCLTITVLFAQLWLLENCYDYETSSVNSPFDWCFWQFELIFSDLSKHLSISWLFSFTQFLLSTAEEAFEMKVLPSDGLGIIIRVCSTWENSLEIEKRGLIRECWSIQTGSGTFPLSLPTRIFKCCGSSSLHVGRHLSRWTDCATDWVNRSKGMPQESQFTCFTIDYAVSKGQISSHRL